MVQVFDKVIKREAFTSGEIGTMREAYLSAAATLRLSDNAERRRLAKIVQKIAKLEPLPAAPVLARTLIDWYISEQAND